MPRRNSPKHFSTRGGAAAYMHLSARELLDAIITAAAMVAKADGRVDPVERSQLLAFLNDSGLLAIFTRKEVLARFDNCTRQLGAGSAAEVTIGSLRRIAGRSLARLVIEAGRAVATADGRIHPRESRVLALIRIALSRDGESLKSLPGLS